MRTWRLELATTAGASVDVRRAALRYNRMVDRTAMRPRRGCRAARRVHRAAGAVLLLGLNYAWAFVDRDRQYLHDRIAGTLLLRIFGREAQPGIDTARRPDGQDL